MATEITLAELEAEIARLGGPTTEAKGKTVDEFVEEWGCGENKVRALLKRAKLAKPVGVLRIGKKFTESLNGIRRQVPCYWFEFPAKSE